MKKTEINHINQVVLLTNTGSFEEVKNKLYYNYLVLALDDESFLLYNLNLGKERKEKINILDVTPGLTYAYEYYHDNDDFQSNFNLGEIKTIKYYRDSNLIKNSTEEKYFIFNSDYLELEDIYGTKIYVDILRNHIYTRNFYEIESKKEFIIYKKDELINFDINIFYRNVFKRLIDKLKDFVIE